MKIYTYSRCSGCRGAVADLEAKGISFEEVAIEKTPPTVAELRHMLAAQQGKLRKLFNVSGQLYRSMGLKDKLADMSEDEVLQLLSQNGMLVKRPFWIMKDGPCGVGAASLKAL